MKMSPYDLDAEEAQRLAQPASTPALTELLVLSGQGIRFAVLGHYGFSAYECDTFAAAVASARAQLAAGHVRAFVAIRIEADLIDGVGDGTEKELVRFEVYPDRVALVPAGQGGLSDEQKAKAIALPKTRWHVARQESPVTQYHLITNIDIVTIPGGTPDTYGSTDVHLHASAIVLARNDHSPRRPGECRIRLFGPDSSWPITDLITATIAHEIIPIVYPIPGALETSYDLRVGDRLLKLSTESQDGAPPDVTSYPDGTPIGDVWRDLRAKVAEHWRAPNMPLLQWVPVEYARRLRKEEIS